MPSRSGCIRDGMGSGRFRVERLSPKAGNADEIGDDGRARRAPLARIGELTRSCRGSGKNYKAHTGRARRGRRSPGPAQNEETLMRSLRTSVAAACLIAIAPAFVSAQNEPSKKERDIVQRDIILGFKPILKGVEYDVPADPAGDRRLQDRDRHQRPEEGDRLRAPRRSGQAAPQVRRHRRQRQDGPVELLPGRLRGLPRERPEQRQEPRRVPLAEHRRDPRSRSVGEGARSPAGSGSRPRRRPRSSCRRSSRATSA